MFSAKNIVLLTEINGFFDASLLHNYMDVIKSDEIITRENIDLENEISKLESIFSDINSLKYLIVEENSDSFLEFEKYLTDLIDNRNNELMRQNIARFLTKLVSEWKSIISQNMDKLRY